MAVGGGQPVTGREQEAAFLGEGNAPVLGLTAGYTVCFVKNPLTSILRIPLPF